MTTTNALVTTGPTVSTMWTEADIKLIQETVAKGATESEFKLVLYMADKYGLDPLLRQIWCVKYGNNPAAIYAGRDGFLAIAQRSGQLDGIDTDIIRDEKGRLIAAICTVWRKDMSHPVIVRVWREEYDTGKGNWSKMPITMLSKVAESQALRKAFNISGLYDQAEYDPEAEAQNEPTAPRLAARPAQAQQPQPQQSQQEVIEAVQPTQPVAAVVAAQPKPGGVSTEPITDRACPKCDGPLERVQGYSNSLEPFEGERCTDTGCKYRKVYPTV